MKWNRSRRAGMGLAGAGIALLLSGCASYVDTQVTAFSDWSGSDATRTYAFTRAPAQRNSLEQATYEQIVGNELSNYAFTRVRAKDAHYLVGLAYGIQGDRVTVPQPIYYDPWFGSPGPWGSPFGPWGPFPAGYVNQTYQIFDRMLEIRIIDRATGKEIYDVSARNSGGDASLLQAMPYLARAALAGFPLGNGVVRTVRLPVDLNGAQSAPANERAVPTTPAPAPAPASDPAATQATVQ